MLKTSDTRMTRRQILLSFFVLISFCFIMFFVSFLKLTSLPITIRLFAHYPILVHSPPNFTPFPIYLAFASIKKQNPKSHTTQDKEKGEEGKVARQHFTFYAFLFYFNPFSLYCEEKLL